MSRGDYGGSKPDGEKKLAKADSPAGSEDDVPSWLTTGDYGDKDKSDTEKKPAKADSPAGSEDDVPSWLASGDFDKEKKSNADDRSDSLGSLPIESSSSSSSDDDGESLRASNSSNLSSGARSAPSSVS